MNFELVNLEGEALCLDLCTKGEGEMKGDMN
jgi:hypothetical protein